MTEQMTSLPLQDGEEVGKPNGILNNVNIDYHVKELEEEIKREFIKVLKNNVIDPYKINTVLRGENFDFVYTGVKRFKHIIRFKFKVYRLGEFNLSRSNYDLSIGTIYVNVRI